MLPIAVTLPHTKKQVHQSSLSTICIGMGERFEVHIRKEYKLPFLEQLRSNLRPNDYGKPKYLRPNQDPNSLLMGQNSSAPRGRFVAALRAIRVKHVMLKGGIGSYAVPFEPLILTLAENGV
eukprot:7377250-Prymnesium_polylepis.4